MVYLFNINDFIFFPISTQALVRTTQFSINLTISYQLILWHQINYWNWMVICFACNKCSTSYHMIDIHMHWVQCIYTLYAYGTNLLVLLTQRLSLGCCAYSQAEWVRQQIRNKMPWDCSNTTCKYVKHYINKISLAYKHLPSILPNTNLVYFYSF